VFATIVTNPMYWTAQKKEGIMRKTLYDMKEESRRPKREHVHIERKPVRRGQSSLSDF